MVILNVSDLTNNQWAGININVPLFVKGISKYEEIANLNCNNMEINNLKDFKNYYTLKDIKRHNISFLVEPFNKPDLVIFQCVYNMHYPLIARRLERLNIPYTIIPRCSMTEKAQEKSKVKKKIFNKLLFNRFIKKAKFIEFLTNNEYLESKKSFEFQDHIVIGNGYNTPDKHYEMKNREEFRIVFVGRYALFHKGLDILFDAIALERKKFIENKIKFVFYGPNFENGKDKLLKIVEDNELQEIVELNDSIFGEEKEKVLLNADMFIHTSRLEGHPTSVIESISYGIPVLVTPGTNMLDDVKNNGLGYFCDLDKREIADTIIRAYEEKENFKVISDKEINFAKDNYNWDNIIRKNIETYKRKLKG